MVSDCIFIRSLHNRVAKYLNYILLWIGFRLYFYSFFTQPIIKIAKLLPLWIGFRLYFYSFFTQPYINLKRVMIVVNWFQIVFLFVLYTTTGAYLAFQVIVVNWFQIVFLFVLYTTVEDISARQQALWIGFRLYFYSFFTQRNCYYIQTIYRCELVSDCIFIRSLHNIFPSVIIQLLVVNWFQIVFLFVLYTTLYLSPRYASCCELVSDCIFIRSLHNSVTHYRDNHKVVNWFQIVFLFVLYTTFLVVFCYFWQLWIGFRLYFYSFFTQLHPQHPTMRLSCELVSDCIFIRSLHNGWNGGNRYVPVVNWFQIVFLFVLYTTTVSGLTNQP